MGSTAYLAALAVLALLVVRVYFDSSHTSRLSRFGWSSASALAFPVGFIAFLVYRYVINPSRRASRPANQILQD